ncbi:hypothetical protein [Rhizobium leguminosarum]
MIFRVASTGLPPVIVAWLERRFGGYCDETALLMLTAIPGPGASECRSVEAHHVEIVSIVAGIARMSGRPQRVPTLAEFIDFALDYWSDDSIRAAHYEHGKLVSRAVVAEIVATIAARNTARTMRIDGPQAA